jgi:hypothetical protein
MVRRAVARAQAPPLRTTGNLLQLGGTGGLVPLLRGIPPLG